MLGTRKVGTTARLGFDEADELDAPDVEPWSFGIGTVRRCIDSVGGWADAEAAAPVEGACASWSVGGMMNGI